MYVRGFRASRRLRSGGGCRQCPPGGHPSGDGRSGSCRRGCRVALRPIYHRQRDGRIRGAQTESKRGGAALPGTGSSISASPPPISLGQLHSPERGRKLQSREGGGDAAGAGRSELGRAQSRAPGPVKVSLPQPQGARCPETLPRAWAANSRGPLGVAGTPGGKQLSRNRGTSESRTERRAVLLGRPGARPRRQVLLGAAAMGEPVLGAGDQPPLLPRPPRSRGPSPSARSGAAESPSRVAGPPPPRCRPGLCL